MKQQTSQEIEFMKPSTRSDRTLNPPRRAAMAGLLALPFATRAGANDSDGRASDAQLLAVRERVWRDWSRAIAKRF
jgi:hypothetical protein